MRIDTIQVFRKSDKKRLGYIFFSKTRGRLAFSISPTGQELRWNALETLHAALPQIESMEIFEVVKEGVGRVPVSLGEHGRLIAEKDGFYLKRIVEVLPELLIPEYVASISEYGNPQPDRIYGKCQTKNIEDAEIKVVKDTVKVNNYDFQKLVGAEVEASSPVRCPLCANSHTLTTKVKVQRVEGKKAYAGAGSGYLWCSMPYAGGEFRVNWGGAELAIVATEYAIRHDPNDDGYW
jgi:hypothetical protein